MQFVVVIKLVRCVVIRVNSFHINVCEFNFDVSRYLLRLADHVMSKVLTDQVRVLLLCVCVCLGIVLFVLMFMGLVVVSSLFVLCVLVLVSFSLS